MRNDERAPEKRASEEAVGCGGDRPTHLSLADDQLRAWL